MGVSGWTRGSWLAVGAGALAVACGSAFAGVQFVNRVEIDEITPPPGGAVATSRPLISLDASNVVGMRDLTVTIDGKDRTRGVSRRADGRLILPAAKLAEGPHTVHVRFGTRNVFSRTVDQTWTFAVDTKLPPLAVASPKPGAETNTRSVKVTGRSEPAARVQVGWRGGTVTAVTNDHGAWTADARLPEGTSTLKVVATDAAGNAAVTSRAVAVDTKAPLLALDKVPSTLTTTDAPVFTGTIRGERPERAILGATVNGHEVVAPHGVRGADAAGDPTPGVTFTGRKFMLSVGRIPQGRSTVTVFVRDPAGNASSRTLSFSVDSTETFGSRDLAPGAKGADVKQLQRELRDRGFKRTKLTGVYDDQTIRSVKGYQRVHKISQTGQFGPRTRTMFVGRIVVTLSKFQLRLIRDGKVVAKFKVAVGQAAYPTPTGNYKVVNKQSNPTWTPPPGSSWAKGLGPIPPGPGNPLGTRWIGTSAPYVGIHGTYAGYSIGTRASHGCIRMHIKDVEALYEMVSVGMPVQLRA